MNKKTEYIFDIDPIAKPRMTRRDKFNPGSRAINYFSFKKTLKLMANLKGLVDLPGDLTIYFRIKMPESWSNKKKLENFNTPHCIRPDLDNLIKSVMDTLCPGEDSHIYRIYAEKFWNDKGQIYIII